MLFCWLFNRGNVDVVSSRSRLSKAFIELFLKKKIPATRWTGLERPNLSGNKFVQYFYCAFQNMRILKFKSQLTFAFSLPSIIISDLLGNRTEQIMLTETITAETQYACHDLSVWNKRQKSHSLSQNFFPQSIIYPPEKKFFGTSSILAWGKSRVLPTDPLFTLLPSRSHGECISKILNSAFLPSKFHSFDRH